MTQLTQLTEPSFSPQHSHQPAAACRSNLWDLTHSSGLQYFSTVAQVVHTQRKLHKFIHLHNKNKDILRIYFIGTSLVMR